MGFTPVNEGAAAAVQYERTTMALVALCAATVVAVVATGQIS